MASSAAGRSRVADCNLADPPLPDGDAVYLHQLFREPNRHPHVSRELPLLYRTLAWGTLTFLVITCIVVLAWMMFHPTFPRLQVTSATISAVAVTATTATAGCNITFLLTNPNRHLITMYDRMDIALFYSTEQMLLSHASPPPIVLPKRSRVTIGSNLSFNGVDLGNDVVKAMMQDVDRGSLSLGIKVFAAMRYKIGKWKTRHKFMRAYCVGMSFAFTSTVKPGIFLNPYQECEVYIYSK